MDDTYEFKVGDEIAEEALSDPSVLIKRVIVSESSLFWRTNMGDQYEKKSLLLKVNDYRWVPLVKWTDEHEAEAYKSAVICGLHNKAALILDDTDLTCLSYWVAEMVVLLDEYKNKTGEQK